jgi:transcriptional regulator with XRE-family HTH domain
MEKFGQRLGVTKQTISRIENGTNNLTGQMFLFICREYGVDEEWLRSGNGNMFVRDTSDELDTLAKKYNLSDDMRVFVEKFVHASPETRETLLSFAKDLAAGTMDLSEYDSNPEKTIDEKVADYRHQLELEEQSKGGSSALRTDA